LKKVLVTGGSGFIGGALIKDLARKGIETVTICRGKHPHIDKFGAIHFQGDIRNQQLVNDAAKGCDVVFHVAAKAGIWGAWKDYYSINVTGTENIFHACRVNKIPALVYTSTPSVVFNGQDITGADETIPYAENFLCHYAHTKAIAEQKVLAANSNGLRTVALRPHLVWGPGDTNLIPRLLDRGRRGVLKQVGDGQNLVAISYIDNVVAAHLLAAENLEKNGSAAGKAYFVSQGEPVNLWQWINDLFARLQIPPVSSKISFNKAYVAGLAMETVYGVLRIKREPLMTRFLAEQLAKSHWFSMHNAKGDFGYEPIISTEEGLDRLLDFVQKGR
jgi:nucleoside-diphosphate-sugar epimerase